jgi:hypothetical protein
LRGIEAPLLAVLRTPLLNPAEAARWLLREWTQLARAVRRLERAVADALFAR